MTLEILTLCTKKNSISWSTKNYHGQGLSPFWPADPDVYKSQFPPQGSAWHHQWMLKVTLCGRKCTANKPEPGSTHDCRHIMTSPGYTGISRRDMQTSAPTDIINRNTYTKSRNHTPPAPLTQTNSYSYSPYPDNHPSSSSSSNTLLPLIQDKAYIEDVAIKSLTHTHKET